MPGRGMLQSLSWSGGDFYHTDSRLGAAIRLRCKNGAGTKVRLYPRAKFRYQARPNPFLRAGLAVTVPPHLASRQPATS